MSLEQNQKVKGRKIDLLIFSVLVLILAVDFICKKLGFSFIESLMNLFVFADRHNIDQVERRSYLLGFLVDLFLFILVVAFFGEGIAILIKRKFPVSAFFRPFDIRCREGMDAISMGVLWIFFGILTAMPLLLQMWYWLK